MTINHQHCPVCGSSQLQEVFTVADFSVTRQQFPLWHCSNCSFRFTQNAPDAPHIGPYYQFEDYISHTDTKKGLVNRLYHRVRNYTLKQKRKKIVTATGLRTGLILDVGCGTGAFLNEMQQAGWAVTGLEPDAGARARAKDLYGIEADAPDALFRMQPGQFNAITMWHVLEHVHELQAYMRQLKQLLQPGGVLFIAVPNYTSKDAAAYGPYWAAWDVPRHLWHFSPQAMAVLAGQNGFEITAHQPMWFDSFYVSMLSEKYRKGGMIRAVWNGLRSNLAALFNTKKCSSVIYRLRVKEAD